jgi:hypothetical protein
MTLGPTDLPSNLAAVERSQRAQNDFRAGERAAAADREEDRASGEVRETRSVEELQATEDRKGARSFALRKRKAGEEHASPPPEAHPEDPEGRGRSVDVRI